MLKFKYSQVLGVCMIIYQFVKSSDYVYLGTRS